VSTRKSRGRETERLVAERLRSIWPHAHATAPGAPGPDVNETPGYAIEVKARRGLNLPEWMRQASRHSAAHGGTPLLIVRLDGQGPASVDDWPVVMRLADFIDLERA
jgi:hypothetical protein